MAGRAALAACFLLRILSVFDLPPFRLYPFPFFGHMFILRPLAGFSCYLLAGSLSGIFYYSLFRLSLFYALISVQPWQLFGE